MHLIPTPHIAATMASLTDVFTAQIRRAAGEYHPCQVRMRSKRVTAQTALDALLRKTRRALHSPHGMRRTQHIKSLTVQAESLQRRVQVRARAAARRHRAAMENEAQGEPYEYDSQETAIIPAASLREAGENVL